MTYLVHRLQDSGHGVGTGQTGGAPTKEYRFHPGKEDGEDETWGSPPGCLHWSYLLSPNNFQDPAYSLSTDLCTPLSRSSVCASVTRQLRMAASSTPRGMYLLKLQ